MTAVRSRRGGRALLGGALLIGSILALHGCYVPPIVMPAGRPALDLADFPAGARLVELEVRDEGGATRRLRGVELPPAPGGAVVLDLLGSLASISIGARPFGSVSIGGDPDEAPVAEGGLGTPLADGWPPESPHRQLGPQHRWLARLAALGWGGLCVDYEGVGASEGERDPDVLHRDALAAWNEALRLADGDASRVILRGTSIGTLAAALLLQEGIRPGAVLLVAPVRAETVALNFARGSWHPALLWCARWFVRDAVDVDLIDALGRCPSPLLVVVPRDDALLPADEAALAEQAVARAGGVLLVRRLTHEGLALAGRDLLAVELAFVQRRAPDLLPDRLSLALETWRAASADGDVPTQAFDAGSAARARLEVVLAQAVLPTPACSLAAALAGVRDEELPLVADWLSWLPAERLAGRELSELVALLDLDDPAGRLGAEILAEASFVTSGLLAVDLASLLELHAARVRSVETPLMQFSLSASAGVTTRDSEAVFLASLIGWRAKLVDGGLPAADAQRLVLRALLKAAGFADRVRIEPDGRRVLEVRDGGVWREVSAS